MGKETTKTREARGADDALLDDVRQFAAELGFSGTSKGGAAFDDFAPEKAKQKLNSQKPASKQKAASKEKTALVKKSSNEIEKSTSNSDVRRRGKNAAKEKNTQRKQHKHGEGKSHDFDWEGQRGQRASLPTGTRSVFTNRDLGLWWEMAPTSASASGAVVLSPSMDGLAHRAATLLEQEAQLVDADGSRSKNSSLGWLEQAKMGGTTTDKVAAMAVLVQEAPYAHLKSLDGLLHMVSKRGGARAVVGTALDALHELWRDILLPNRKLRYFQQHDENSLPNGRERDKVLVLWKLEEDLKTRYATFVENLARLTTDNLDFVKQKALKIAYDLLLNKPEQEAQLLRIVVNKLGDPDRKMASNAGYLITKLVAQHDGMKYHVVREIENFLYRPGLNDRARYYAVVYLNQLVLTGKDRSVAISDGSTVSLAKKLVDLYFTLFKLIISGTLGTVATIAKIAEESSENKSKEKAHKRGKKHAKRSRKVDTSKRDNDERKNQREGDIDSRMLSALITGIRRAFPFVRQEEIEPLIEVHADSLFLLVHTGSFGVSTQALLLLYQLMSSQASISDRFYRALYSALASSEFPKSTKAPLFMSLLVKAVKSDVSSKRVFAFLKRILQVSLQASSNFACGCLILVSEVLKASPGLWNAIMEPEEEPIEERKQTELISMEDMYCPSKRDPKFANAEKSCLWELVCLSRHCHPSVAAMAKTLLAGVNIQYTGDPLKDLTLSEFLSKFVSKKYKQRVKGDSFMQPLADEAGKKTTMLDSYETINMAPDEAFFHRFHKIRESRGHKRKTSPVQDKDGDSSEAEDEFLAAEEAEETITGDLRNEDMQEYDYSMLASAMEEDVDTVKTTSDAENDDEDTSSASLEGEEFDLDTDDDDNEVLMEMEGDGSEDENIFGAVEDYEDLIQERLQHVS